MSGRIWMSCVAAIGLLAAARGGAHHSFSAEFDADKPLKMTGTVTKVEWMNPHTWFYVDVKDDAGSVASWGFELASPNFLMRSGWSKSSIKTGDVITVEGFHAKSGANIGNARAITLASTGKRFTSGSAGGSQP
ncbi:MAG TPA: DUF6152 family protein [Gammaproteobacteria bacterium]|jgi:hypothetical protein|nr:DUF6152 family protein [Gammaproteobacteria bacterium]